MNCLIDDFINKINVDVKKKFRDELSEQIGKVTEKFIQNNTDIIKYMLIDNFNTPRYICPNGDEKTLYDIDIVSFHNRCILDHPPIHCSIAQRDEKHIRDIGSNVESVLRYVIFSRIRQYLIKVDDKLKAYINQEILKTIDNDVDEILDRNMLLKAFNRDTVNQIHENCFVNTNYDDLKQSLTELVSKYYSNE